MCLCVCSPEPSFSCSLLPLVRRSRGPVHVCVISISTYVVYDDDEEEEENRIRRIEQTFPHEYVACLLYLPALTCCSLACDGSPVFHLPLRTSNRAQPGETPLPVIMIPASGREGRKGTRSKRTTTTCCCLFSLSLSPNSVLLFYLLLPSS